ncbi:MAG: hypothetical protein AAF393_15625 [Pseudomonadota bacterium]
MKTALPALVLTLITAATQIGAQALDMKTCDRITHVSHGGAAGHVDYGGGKVGWVDWWSQEGVFKDVWLADCQTGQALKIRTHEERIKDRYIPDKTRNVRRKLATWAADASAFFTVDWMAGQLAPDGRDATVAAFDTEFCGCQVAYPELRGAKTPYKPAQ